MSVPRLVAFIALCAALPAMADSWVVCDYDVESVRIGANPPELTVRVRRGHARNGAECPAGSGERSFVPETADYQSNLPRKQWPKPGQPALLRYRHLDGICKPDRPCRIIHQSILPAAR
ncbi:hypothetical protein [Piscinibacter gummiphilus]|uniref:Uncharacterized protein n=1 Tax=Piscinibacter gummiphilus TaxID=946333 RepID=A0A1W6L6G3_9BURK|nr:hypothetical protein [Piscinibacter gummiphilus]ARN19787.1 hypothetical protein A4W93_07600 [Piscinibacter gummiphilus]GLS95139.1 hypothetical protein GCM10007918_24310 [Piscinibacter gummiphilus]